MARKKLSKKEKAYVEKVSKQVFEGGKLIVSSDGKKLNKHDPQDRKRIMAIIYNEAEDAAKHGTKVSGPTKRRTRTRPKNRK